jgi:ergothioneine biosynthesis protein EgtB
MKRESADRAGLARSLGETRQRSLQIAAPLSAEDACAQAMPDASPTKWHLAHTTWFFSTFVLEAHGVAPEAPGEARYLFNSYYEAVGPRHARPARGLITRPGLTEVLSWRARVDAALDRFVLAANDDAFAEALPLLQLGIAHEEQHQELMLTDILALFAAHPSCPAYVSQSPLEDGPTASVLPCDHSLGGEGELAEIGAPDVGFAFDCERPRHKVWLEPFAIAPRFVSNGDWLAFIQDGGYATSSLWLSDGWDCVRREGWTAPGYWLREEDGWTQATLHGRRPIDLEAPVSHVSFWEADAFARWAGRRLPREAEWESVAAGCDRQSARFQSGRLAPTPGDQASFFGSVWVWTQSAFAPYPRFLPASGAVGEYNGKFMANQFVLRGGSCVTPPGHVRASYRNFFQPEKRWQFTGVRLAKDL